VYFGGLNKKKQFQTCFTPAYQKCRWHAWSERAACRLCSCRIALDMSTTSRWTQPGTAENFVSTRCLLWTTVRCSLYIGVPCDLTISMWTLLLYDDRAARQGRIKALGAPSRPLDAEVLGPPGTFLEFFVAVACRRVLEHSELQE